MDIREIPFPTSASADRLNDWRRAECTIDPHTGCRFSLLVPSQMTQDTTHANDEPSETGRQLLAVIKDDSLSIEVEAEELPRAVDALDWMLATLGPDKAVLACRRVVSESGGIDADLLYIDKGQVIRTRACIIGSGLICLTACCDEHSYQERSEEVFCIAASLTLDHPYGGEAEPMVGIRHKFCSQSLAFDIPASWSCNVLDDGQLELETAENGIVMGRMNVRLMDRQAQSGGQREDVIADFIATLGLRKVLNNSACLEEATPPEGFDDGLKLVTEADWDNRRVTVAAFVFQNERSIVLVGLTSLSRDASPRWWAVNKFALQRLTRTLSLSSTTPIQQAATSHAK